MSITVAVTGKSGSGKTTITKNLARLFQKLYPEKSILLFDNDLTNELGHSFGLDVRNTIYGIRSGKHEYKTGIPSKMTKQEYVEWALEDIVVNIEPNLDLITSWFVGSKDCRCPITNQLREALKKFVLNYDIVIFDCEFDLKYLNQLLDVPIDVTLILSKPTLQSINLAKRIEEFSAKYAVGGQMGVVLNGVRDNETEKIYEVLNQYRLETLGVIPLDSELAEYPAGRESEVIINALKQFYGRLNLPQSGAG